MNMRYIVEKRDSLQGFDPVRPDTCFAVMDTRRGRAEYWTHSEQDANSMAQTLNALVVAQRKGTVSQ